MTGKKVPQKFHTITPYLIINGVEKVIEFLKEAFDAETNILLHRPDGSVMHAEIRMGDSIVLMGEPMEGFAPMPTMIYYYTNEVDEVYRKALEAGAISVMEPANQFYGDRNAGVRDSAGNLWWIATHIEDVSPEEMKKRAEEAFKKQ